MADPQAWRDLRGQFLRINNNNKNKPMSAMFWGEEWAASIVKSGWSLTGGTHEEQSEFRRLARIGARLLGHPQCEDRTEWAQWLATMRTDSLIDVVLEPTELAFEDGEQPSIYTIENVCAKSADYCELVASGVAQQVATASDQRATSEKESHALEPESAWCDVEIIVISDHRVQVKRAGKSGPSYNYADLGFGDRRKKGDIPIASWNVLLQLAVDGRIQTANRLGRQRVQLEKQVQTIRAKLREALKIDGDPIPLSSAGFYEPIFKLIRSRSADV